MSNFASTGTLDMSTMAAALPDYQMRQFQQQPYTQHYQSPGAPNPSMMYQYHQGAQFAGQAAANPSHSFAQQYPSPFVQAAPTRQQPGAAYSHYVPNTGLPGGPQPFQNQSFLLHHSGTASQHHQQQQQQPHFTQPHASSAYGVPYGTGMASGYALPQLRLDNSMAQIQTSNVYPQLNPQGMEPLLSRRLPQ
jgi:hypothetical protein